MRWNAAVALALTVVAGLSVRHVNGGACSRWRCRRLFVRGAQRRVERR